MSDIQKLIRDIVEPSGVYIEDIRISDISGKIRVICDTDAGISSEKLIDISKMILNDPLYDEKYASDYRLEVSSPGIDTPLTLLRHFRKNLGRELEVHHRCASFGDPLKGTLHDIEDDILVMTVKKKKKTENLRIPFDKVEYARIILKW